MGVFEKESTVWLNDSSDNVYVHYRIIANWHVLQCKAEPLENNWALAPMDQWKRYGRVYKQVATELTVTLIG